MSRFQAKTLTELAEGQVVSKEQYVREAKAAAFLDYSRALLRKWRRTGGGPVFARTGRLVRYKVSDLIDWMDSHRT